MRDVGWKVIVLAALAAALLACDRQKPYAYPPGSIHGPKVPGGVVPPGLVDPVVSGPWGGTFRGVVSEETRITRDFGLTTEPPCSEEAHAQEIRWFKVHRPEVVR